MEVGKRAGLARGVLAGSTPTGEASEASKDAGARSKLVLGTLAGFALMIVMAKALVGSAGMLMIAVCVFFRLRPRPAWAAVPRHGWAIFFDAMATAFLPWLLLNSWPLSLWRPIPFSPH